MIEGTQVNFEAAILGYSNDDPYQHYYFINANIASSDLQDSYSNETVINPCTSNPCKNGGLCFLNKLTNSSICFCSLGYTGI